MEAGVSADVLLGFLPFYHLYALVMFQCYIFLRGCTVVIMKKFHPLKYMEYCEKYKVSHLSKIR